MCISLGIFEGKHAKALINSDHFKPPAADADIPKASTAEESQALARLRKACSNTAHLCVVCLSDTSLWELCHIVVETMQPLREWQTSQSTTLRSTGEVAKWYCEQACGKVLNLQRDLFERLSKPAHWSHIGFGKHIWGCQVWARPGAPRGMERKQTGRADRQPYLVSCLEKVGHTTFSHTWSPGETGKPAGCRRSTRDPALVD